MPRGVEGAKPELRPESEAGAVGPNRERASPFVVVEADLDALELRLVAVLPVRHRQAVDARGREAGGRAGRVGERARRDIEQHRLFLAVAQAKAHARAVAGNLERRPQLVAHVGGARTLKRLDRAARARQPERGVGRGEGEAVAAGAEIHDGVRRNRDVGTAPPSVRIERAQKAAPHAVRLRRRAAARRERPAVARPCDVC